MAWETRRFLYDKLSMARADIRVRVRPVVIRVRIGEAAIRTVIRITAPKNQLCFPPPTVHAFQLSSRYPLPQNEKVDGF